MHELRPDGEGEPVRLLLIRHAESQGNHEGRLQGRKEFPLTERGQRQAQLLAERLVSQKIAAVYSSPIVRARDTALEIAGAVGLKVIPEPRVQEYDFGEELSGLTWQEIRDQKPEIIAALTGKGSEFPRYPGEEGRANFRERVCAALGDIAERHRSDEAVAVITHAGPIVVYVMETLGRGYGRPIPFVIDNTSVTTIELSSGGHEFVPAAVLTGLNDTCHLAGASS